MLAHNVLDLINNTPMIYLNKIKEKYQLYGNIIGKLEKNNPTGSVKDRAALQMILDAEANGLIDKETVIIEPTSGNTGIALSAICAYRGYKLIICMPETMSIERRKLMMAYGAEIILTEGKQGMKGSVNKANEIAKIYPNHFIPSQFSNKSNPKAHYLHTGKEIYEGLNHNISVLVAGIGTGGTISGTGRYLKEQNEQIKVVGVEPFESPTITKGISSPHKIQGIGAGFIPDNFENHYVDEVIAIKGEEALAFVKEMAKEEGLLLGISSCAAILTAMQIASKPEYENKNIVVILPDGGERYLSLIEEV